MGMFALFIKAYPAILLSVVLLDLLWLGVLMKDFYKARLGHLMGDTVVWSAAVVFYLVFSAGLMYFAVLPAISAHSLLKAAILGALLGALAYATYDLTNHATLKEWPLAVTLIDIAWGAFLSACAASAGFFAVKLFS